MSILDSIAALTAEQTAAARQVYSGLIREQNPTPAQAGAFAASMELLGKTPADVRADLAIIAQVEEIESRLTTPAQEAAATAKREQADKSAMVDLPRLAASVCQTAPSALIARDWLYGALHTANWFTGPDRRRIAGFIATASAGVTDTVAEGAARNAQNRQRAERCGIIATHPTIYPGGQFDPRWSLEQPTPADTQGDDTQGDPAPEVSADVEAVEPTPAPAEPELSLPFSEPAGNRLLDAVSNKRSADPAPAQDDDTLPFDA